MSNEDLDRDADSILHKHADAHIVMAQKIAVLTATGRAQLDIIEALEFRIVVLESQMENVRARLDGHDLGFVTMGLDDDGKESLARMQRLGRTIDPDEEGTSRS